MNSPTKCHYKILTESQITHFLGMSIKSAGKSNCQVQFSQMVLWRSSDNTRERQAPLVETFDSLSHTSFVDFQALA